MKEVKRAYLAQYNRGKSKGNVCVVLAANRKVAEMKLRKRLKLPMEENVYLMPDLKIIQ